MQPRYARKGGIYTGHGAEHSAKILPKRKRHIMNHNNSNAREVSNTVIKDASIKLRREDPALDMV